MNKLQLPQVTLVGIDCINVERLQKALDISEQGINFGQVKLLTSLPTNDKRRIAIPHIGSIEAFSEFCIKDLSAYIDTKYVLLIQHDGFVLNPSSWQNTFLNYDYIGAPWLVEDWAIKNFDFPLNAFNQKIVGNGGFSLRSKKFLEISSELANNNLIEKYHPEDVSLCVWNRSLLEQNNVRFAPIEIAEKFSIEGKWRNYDNQFGFHGAKRAERILKWIEENPSQTASETLNKISKESI